MCYNDYMYDKIKNDISNDYYVNNFPNDGQRFVAWYLRNIHGLDVEQAKYCMTDGAGDKQIDAVYIDNDSCTVFIIQGKYYNGTIDAEPIREVVAAWLEMKNLERLQETANGKLRIKINEVSEAINEDDYAICFELITTGDLTPAAIKDWESFQKVINEDEDLNATFNLIDKESLQIRYDDALDSTSKPFVNYDFQVDRSKCMELSMGGIKAVIAAIPLKECLKIPGIKDGRLFRKNVRQSLGINNRVNKGIASTIKNDAANFFFLHNGITAICSSLELDDGLLKTKDLNVVNGCQSLSTIYSSSESVRNAEDGYIMFKFYEITDSVRADKITNSTNSQSAVKARDLRSNDKNVLAMKREYEQRYTDGRFITKRGETIDSEVSVNKNHVINLTELGKWLVAWHSQRPTISYSETKIFDKYFNQLFRKDYAPEKMQALKEIFDEIMRRWVPDNPMGLDESLLAMKSYAPYHQLYAVSVYFNTVNSMPNTVVPNPAVALSRLNDNNLMDQIITMAGKNLNAAMKIASKKSQDSGKMFSPQNWIKTKASLDEICSAILSSFDMLDITNDNKELSEKIRNGLRMDPEDFEERWSAE